MSNVLSPKVAHLYAESGPDAVAKKVWHFVGVISAVLIAFAIFASLYGGKFIVLVFAKNYAGNDVAIAVLAFGTVALGISYSVAAGLRAIDRPDTNFWAGIVGLFVTGIVSCLLVRSHGILGTTIGLVAGFYAMAVLRTVAFQWFIRHPRHSPISERLH